MVATTPILTSNAFATGHGHNHNNNHHHQHKRHHHNHFALNLYYNMDEDDIPNSIRELMPTISPVRVDVMATPHAPDDPKVKYMKVAQLFDDGSICPSYLKYAATGDL
jgi:hypothetical protein